MKLNTFSIESVDGVRDSDKKITGIKEANDAYMNFFAQAPSRLKQG